MQLVQIVLHPGRASAPALARLAALAPDLVLVFGATAYFAAPALAAQLRALLPQAVLAGCSSAGDIAGQQIHEGCCVLTAIKFSSSSARGASTPLAGMADSHGAGMRLASQLERTGLRAVLLFGTGLAINGSALIASLRAHLPPMVTVSGGLASDGGAFARTWTLGPAGCTDDAVVAVGLYGERLELRYGSQGGWEPFGPARKVTRAHANVLYELDGERALDVYRRYLGDYAQDLPASGLLFPFEMLDAARRPGGVLRTILGVDPEAGSLTLAGNPDADGYLRLMHSSTDQLIAGAGAAAAQATQAAQDSQAAQDTQAGPGACLALLVSCIGRKLVMGERVEEEVEAVAARLGAATALAGFYAHGEIAPTADRRDGKLHNQTMTITLLTET